METPTTANHVNPSLALFPKSYEGRVAAAHLLNDGLNEENPPHF
jgi:hypothetical protein